MKRTTLTNHINAFTTETLMLLRFQFSLNRISKFNNLQSITRSDFVDKLISLKAIENDLVIRICKFDDDTKGVHSFPKAILEIPKTHVNRNKIENKIGQFKQLIDKLKKVRRHTQLAHLKIDTKDDDYEIRYNLTPAIEMIVEIIDLMSNTKINYHWSDGQHEKFDLRYEVLKDQT
jgi:hypothetical protein